MRGSPMDEESPSKGSRPQTQPDRVESPASAVCSCGLPTCWVDVACLQVVFADVLVPKDKPCYRSGAGGKLSIQQVFGESTIIHMGHGGRRERWSQPQRSLAERQDCTLDRSPVLSVTSISHLTINA